MIALVLALAAGGYPSPLAASGRWQIDYATQACRLSREYSQGENRVTAVIERAGDAEGAALYLILPSSDGGPSRGKATIRIDPQGLEQQPYFERWITAAPAHGVVRMWIDADGFRALTSANLLRVRAGSADVSLAPAVTRAALAALSKCNDDLQRGWGLDPGERDRVAVPAKAKGSADFFTTYSDYPTEALRRNEQGTTTISWTIGVDGRVHDCRTVVSSGSATLDAASCEPTSRARYTPAIGKDGKPMATHRVSGMSWRIPGQ